MNSFASLDLLYFVLAVAALWIGVMLTWLLFEAAMFAHRVNKTIKDGLAKLRAVESMISNIKDRLEASSGYLGMLAKGGEVLMGFMEDKATKSRRRRRSRDEDEE